jgi:hypothetical protein
MLHSSLELNTWSIYQSSVLLYVERHNENIREPVYEIGLQVPEDKEAHDEMEHG